MLYRIHDFNRAALGPAVQWARANARLFSTPGWLSLLPGASQLAASYELYYRIGKEYEKPSFGIDAVEFDGKSFAVVEQVALSKPFCRLLHFKRYSDDERHIAESKRHPVVLIVAPLSGHHATLLRETVRTMLVDHDVYITDWIDARLVPTSLGAFTLDDYIAYVTEFVDMLIARESARDDRRGAKGLHVLAVCQPCVPVLAAISLMAAAGKPIPASMVMMGGPIDPRCNPTQVNDLATTKPFDWFESNLIHTVPARYPGRGRRVYPGFLQHTGFIAMNPGRHMNSHWAFYQDLVQGDLENAQAHRRFYDEYNAVLDMPAEYYLDCIRTVFQEYRLPLGTWHVGTERVAPEAITQSALMTIEGELDDITGLGQTRAAHALCAGIPEQRKEHLTVAGAGHYGIFTGRRWRETVYPRVREFFARKTSA